MSDHDVISASVKCFNRSDNVLKILNERAMDGLQKCGEVLREHARNYCPVDTGALQESIDFAVVGKYVVLYAGGDSLTHGGSDKHVDYAGYVEFGTSRMAAQPYLRPAKENHMDEVKHIMDDALIGR